MQNHNDDTIKTSDTVLRKGLCVRGSWRPNRTATYWAPLLWPSAFLSRSPGLINRGPGGPVSLGHVPQSYLQQIWSPNSIGGPRAPSAGCWLSLLHFVSNWLDFLCTELYNSSTSTIFLWASQIALIQPIHCQAYTLLFLDRMHLLFTPGNKQQTIGKTMKKRFYILKRLSPDKTCHVM